MAIPVQPQDIAALWRLDKLQHPPIYATFSQPVYASILDEIRKTRENSMYWVNVDQFAVASEQLEMVSKLPNGWDSYGAEAPTVASVAAANRVLAALRGSSTPPSRITASAEGGVGICFIQGEKYADIEILNNEVMLATMYRGASEPRIWELENREESIRAAIEQIRVHLSA
jgi:hypothetical protein